MFCIKLKSVTTNTFSIPLDFNSSPSFVLDPLPKYDVSFKTILLPHVLRFNGKVCPELFENMGRAFNLDMDNLNEEETVEKVVSAIQELSIKLRIPQTLKEVGIPKEMIPQLAAQALNDVCTPGNPREVTIDDLISIYESAY